MLIIYRLQDNSPPPKVSFLSPQNVVIHIMVIRNRLPKPAIFYVKHQIIFFTHNLFIRLNTCRFQLRTWTDLNDCLFG